MDFVKYIHYLQFGLLGLGSLLRRSEGRQVDATYTDVSKTFDRVDHGLFLKCMTPQEIRLIRSTWENVEPDCLLSAQ